MKNGSKSITRITGMFILAIVAMTLLFAYAFLPTSTALLVQVGIAAIAVSLWHKLGLYREFLSVLAPIAIPYGLQIPPTISYTLIAAAVAIAFINEKGSDAKAFLLGLALGLTAWAGLSLVEHNPLFTFMSSQMHLIYAMMILMVLTFAYVFGNILFRK